MSQTAISSREYDAILFDMDGVVTRTAAVHFAAWKEIFDTFLRKRDGEKFQEFTPADYLDFVDGRPREDGVKTFLASRKIDLAGNESLGQHADTVASLARAKDREFLHLVHTRGVEPYETTISLIKSVRKAGMKTALVTASRNGAEILRVTKTDHLFDATVTGVDAAKLKLKGKPAPDVFLEAARRLGVKPARAIVVEDAQAGVESGKNGHFALVVGVARQDNAKSLKDHGADVVVRDLAELTVADASQGEIRGMAMADLDVTEANWVVSYNKYDPEHEQKRESLCALGNGKFCTRGAAPESHADDIHYPGTYVAGGYDLVRFDIEGGQFEQEELVNMPNWTCLQFKIGEGDWFLIDAVEILDYSQKLNLREGILYRDVRFRDSEERETRIQERRFVHMRYSHVAGVELTVTPLNWSGRITLRTSIDGTIVNSGDPLASRSSAKKHLRSLSRSTENDIISLKVITKDSKLIVATSARTTLFQDGELIAPARRSILQDEYVAQEVDVDVKDSQSLRIQKTCILYTSRDRGIYEPEAEAREAAKTVPDFDSLCACQVKAWRSLWRQFDLFIETTEEYSKLIPSLLLHLNSFHCLQTASTHTIDLDNGIPPRGWTGEGYQGHVFWDDLFVFPFVNWRMPNIGAALLKYRYRRLGQARKIAQSKGASGACFPWQSAGNGKERTPDYSWMEATETWIKEDTMLEMHINGAIAYNVWQYFQVTGDTSFMYAYGSEILLEIARFFATYAKFNNKRMRYEIHGVVGPDEYHTAYPDSKEVGIRNNAYTNFMAVWTLCRALELLTILPADHSQHLKDRLNIADSELKLWQDVRSRMYIPVMKNGIVEQFEGYEKLEDSAIRVEGKVDSKKLDRLLSENMGKLNRYKIAKQADVLMLLFLFSPSELYELVETLGYSRDIVAVEKLADYYISRTVDQSTLSRVAHTWVLARLNRLVNANNLSGFESWAGQEEEIFYEALGSDYYDVAARGTARTGVHLGAMAGTVDIVERCYTGIVTKDEVLWLDPMLPKQLVRLSFSLNYRGQSLSFDIHQDKMQVSARHSSAAAIKIGYGKKVYELKAGETKMIALRTPSLTLHTLAKAH